MLIASDNHLKMSIVQKLDEIEALIASIRKDLGIKSTLRLEAPEYKVTKPTKKEETKKEETKEAKSERYGDKNFIDALYDLAKEQTFKDGTTKLCVSSLPRKKWPLTAEGKMYEKLQDLCADFDVECVRDDPTKPNVYIVLETVTPTKENVKAGAEEGTE